MFKKISDILLKLRYELFFTSLVLILFGSLIFQGELYDKFIDSALFIFNIICGMNLMRHLRRWFRLFLVLFLITFVVIPILRALFPEFVVSIKVLEWMVYLLFYLAVTYQIILQVWVAKNVSKNVIFGLMSGYMALGLVAFLFFSMVSILNPEAFNVPIESGRDSLMYYSFITMTTIGYGDVYPVDPLAQKLAVLFGLMGQFYMVIVMAVVIQKYISNAQE